MSATHTNADGSNSNDIQIGDAEPDNRYSVQCGDVKLTVESTCDYTVKIIPTTFVNIFYPPHLS